MKKNQLSRCKEKKADVKLIESYRDPDEFYLDDEMVSVDRRMFLQQHSREFMKNYDQY